MAQHSILSMFKKTNVQDTICRPGKPTDTLSKSRTADPTFNLLGEPVQDTICRPGKPTDTLSKSRTADPTFNRLGEPVQDTICRPGNPTDTLYIHPRCANNGRIYAVQYNDAGYQHTYK